MYQAALIQGPLGRGITRLVLLLFTLTALITPLQAQQVTLPEIGDPSGNLLSPTQERRLGQAFMRSIRASQPVMNDPLLSTYIESLGQRLVANTENPGRSFNFFLIDNPVVNAFAGPGGNIGVYTGLITTSESESELASVLAHEIVHITQNHLTRTFDAVQRLSLPMTALAIAAVVLGAATNNPEAGLAAATGLQAGIAQTQINFTRYHEEEADRLGIQILAKSGFDPQAMASFFARLGKSSRLYDGGTLPEFLRTHPVTSNRIADARGRAGNYRYRQQPDSLAYHLVRATLKAASFDEPQQAVTFFQGTLASKRYRNEEAERYGYVLALLADQQFERAAEQLRPLLLKRPELVAYLVTSAEIQQQRGQPEQALATLKDGLELYPGNYALTLHYARLLLDNDQGKQALELLQRQIEGRPNDSLLYKIASQAAAKSGDNNLAHQYLAEHYYQAGAIESAAQQLKIALRDKQISYYRSAQMSARLKEMQQEISDLKQGAKRRG